MSNAAGLGAEVLNLVAPRLADWAFWRADQHFDDSAGKGGSASEEPGRDPG